MNKQIYKISLLIKEVEYDQAICLFFDWTDVVIYEYVNDKNRMESRLNRE